MRYLRHARACECQRALDAAACATTSDSSGSGGGESAGTGIYSRSVSELTFVDEARSGTYSYLLEVFLTGSAFKMEIFDAREPGRPHAVITESHALIQQIRKEFWASLARDYEHRREVAVAHSSAE